MVIKARGPLLALLVLFGAGLFGLLFVEHPEPYSLSQPAVAPYQNSRPSESTAPHTPANTATKAEKSADAARDAANAASDRVQISREALVTTERAFVFCERIEHHWFADKATENILEWGFYPVWKNSGTTPTKRGRSCVNSWVAVNVGDLPDDFNFPDYSKAERSMIGPGLTRHGPTLRIPIDIMQKIREGTAHAYMWGWFDYDSIFATDIIRHRSEFCVEIQVIGNPIYKEGGFAFRAHGPFNGFDDECGRQQTAPTRMR